MFGHNKTQCQSQQLHICDPLEKIDWELQAFILNSFAPEMQICTWKAERQIQPCTIYSLKEVMEILCEHTYVCTCA